MSWFNPNEGTFVVEFDYDFLESSTTVLLQFGDNAGSGGITLIKDANLSTPAVFTLRAIYDDGRISSLDNIPKNTKRVAINFISESMVMISTDTGFEGAIQLTGAITFNSMGIGCRRSTGTFPINGTIKSLTYYPKALPSNELQELSRL